VIFMRVFIIKLNRAFENFELNNLSENRMDLVARCVSSAFFLDHDIRRDVKLLLCFDNNKVVEISGEIRQMRPDERSIAGFFKGLLQGKRYNGIRFYEASFNDIIKRYKVFYVLDRKGRAIKEIRIDKPVFIIGDDLGLPDIEGKKISLGPLSYMASHCIVILNNHLDGVIYESA